jgi:hypothetical protein
MPKNTPSIVLSRTDSAVKILFVGFDTSIDPVLIERRAVGVSSWTVIATPSDGDGEVLDDSVIDGVNYEYRATASEQSAMAATATEPKPKSKSPRKEKQAEVVENPIATPPLQPMIFDPWGLLEDISEYDPYAVFMVPKNDK